MGPPLFRCRGQNGIRAGGVIGHMGPPLLSCEKAKGRHDRRGGRAWVGHERPATVSRQHVQQGRAQYFNSLLHPSWTFVFLGSISPHLGSEAELLSVISWLSHFLDQQVEYRGLSRVLIDIKIVSIRIPHEAIHCSLVTVFRLVELLPHGAVT